MSRECWYCGEMRAEEWCVNRVKITRDYKFILFVVGSYERERLITLDIPRCQSCMTYMKHHTSANARYFAAEILLGLISLVCLLVAVANAAIPNTGVRVLIALPAPVALLTVWVMDRRSSKRATEEEVQREMDDGFRSGFDHPEVQRLTDQGWVPKIETLPF